MARKRTIRICLVIASIVLGLLCFCRSKDDRQWQRKFGVVKDGALLRGPLPSAAQLDHLRREYDVKTIVSLLGGDELKEYPDCDAEQIYAKKNGIRFVHMPIGIPREEQLKEFLDLVANAETRPVFVHCLQGTVRTGMLVAVYRMEREGWSNEAALEEMKAYGFDDKNPENKSIVSFVRCYRREAM